MGTIILVVSVYSMGFASGVLVIADYYRKAKRKKNRTKK